MADPVHPKAISLGAIGELPRNRSAGDFGASSSGDVSNPSTSHLPISHAHPVQDGSINLPLGLNRNFGSHASLHDGSHVGGYETNSRSGEFGLEGQNSTGLPYTSQTDALAAAMGNLDVNDAEHRYGVSGLKRNPRSFANLSHGTGLHIDDGIAPQVQPRTLVISNISPDMSDESLSQDLQSFGDVQSLFTGLKNQGQVRVTFFDSNQAMQAYSLLNRRKFMNHQLYVEPQKSQKDAIESRLLFENVSDGIDNEEVKGRMSELFGPVSHVADHAPVPRCKEVYFTDVRNAQNAHHTLHPYPQNPNISTINEDSESAPLDTLIGTQGMFRPQGLSEQPQYTNRGYINNNIPTNVSKYGNQGLGTQGLSSNPELVQLLNNTTPDTLDHYMQQGYLSQKGSTNSLNNALGASGNFGSSTNLNQSNFGSSSNLNSGNFGSSANLNNASGNFGSSANLNNASGNFGSSANLPSAGNRGSTANLAGQSEFGSSANLVGSTNNLMSSLSGSASHNNLSGMLPGGVSDGLGQGFTPQQLAALQSGMMGVSGSLNKAKRSMTTNDLYSLSQNNNLSGMGGPLGSGSYDPSELSGWGGSTQQPDLETANLLAQAQALSTLNGLGGAGMQRSVSALQLQQLNQQAQQQQILMQLAAYNPQALQQQLSNMRLAGSLPSGFGRGKGGRGEEALSGGRLSRRAADPAVEAERRAQQERHYALDAGKVERGEDSRTTLMIKNIPNKYTQKMILQTIDEQFSRQYDFFYLPIDFKNKCNVGYAFINMVQPKYIIPFMVRFNQRKWERFNSEKVCHISYARIQGKQQLVTHFQNSSLLHEDKRCRPILFKTDGDLAGEQEPFPSANSAMRSHRARPANSEPPVSEAPSVQA